MVPSPKSTLKMDGARGPGDVLDNSDPKWEVPLKAPDPTQNLR